nr:hypothetical protein [Tanacetum cinerariifolium]
KQSNLQDCGGHSEEHQLLHSFHCFLDNSINLYLAVLGYCLKSNPSAPKADLRPPVTKPASSQQPKPKPAPTKSQEKKLKMVTETSDKPSLAKRSKPGLVTKRRKPTSSLRSVDESVDKGIPEKKPRFDDEEADIQRAVEESLKSVHDAPRGALSSVVIREPDSGKFQPLLEVQGKGKEKVSDEQVSRDLLTLQKPKKVRPNPGVLTKGQAGSDPGDGAEPQPQSSLVVHAGPNLKHIDLEATDVSTQLHPDFGDLLFNDKPSKVQNEKTTAETKAESMVFITIQQDTSAIPPMTTPVIDLTSRPDSSNAHRPLQAMATETTTNNNNNSSTTTSTTTKHHRFHVDKAYQDLPEVDMKGILHQRMWETNSYKAHEDHMMLYEALDKSMNRNHTEELLKDPAEARKNNKKRRDSPKMPPGSPPHQPPPPPPPACPS